MSGNVNIPPALRRMAIVCGFDGLAHVEIDGVELWGFALDGWGVDWYTSKGRYAGATQNADGYEIVRIRD